MKAKIIATGLLLLSFLFFTQAAAEDSGLPVNKGEKEANNQPEKIYILNAYRYEGEPSSKDADLGQSLCGTRCNALASDYRNYIEPPGWRIIRRAKDKEVTIPLHNPFIDGSCVCTVDEYEVKVNELYMSK